MQVLIDDVYARWTPRKRLPRLAARRRSGGDVQPDVDSARLHAAHLRNHRKLLVIDGETGFTGGMNIFSRIGGPMRQAGPVTICTFVCAGRWLRI